MANLDQTLTALKTLLPVISDAATIGDGARPFCTEFYALYRQIKNGMSRSDYSKVLDFFQQSTPAVSYGISYISQDLVDRLEEGLRRSFQGMEWIQMCELRSTFEAFRELYSDYLPVEAMIPEIDKVDDRFEAKGEFEAILNAELTPINFPQTHWWWTLD